MRALNRHGGVLRFAAPLVFVFLAASCAGADEDLIRPGILELPSEPMHVVTPASVSVGITFTVQVTTFGGSCESLERTDVTLVAEGAIVTPYDRTHVSGGGTNCPVDGLRGFQHEASLSFDSTGSKTVRFHGRQGMSDQEIEIPYPIVVNE